MRPLLLSSETVFRLKNKTTFWKEEAIFRSMDGCK